MQEARRGDDRGAGHRGRRRTRYFDYYYGLIDFEFLARKYLGEDVVTWMKANVHPLDIVFRLAEDHGIVLLNGSGFAAPDWSVRISFANLDDHVYDDIGRAVRAIARGYRQAYEASLGKGGHACTCQEAAGPDTLSDSPTERALWSGCPAALALAPSQRACSKRT